MTLGASDNRRHAAGDRGAAALSLLRDWDERRVVARRLLHDKTINTTDRVAGLLALLYAQKASNIRRLTTDRVRYISGASPPSTWNSPGLRVIRGFLLRASDPS